MTKPIRLIYISRGSPQLTDDEVNEIVLKSRQNNGPKGIGGFLCFNNNIFLQILEGPEQEVLKLYSTICVDPRHSHVTILGIELVDQIQFGKWAMGFIAQVSKGTLQWEELLKLRQLNTHSNLVSEVWNLMCRISHEEINNNVHQSVLYS